MLKQQHDNEYELIEGLLKKSIYHFYSTLIMDYIQSEMDIETKEYHWVINKSNWIKDSEKNPDSILSLKDKQKLIDSNKVIK